MKRTLIILGALSVGTAYSQSHKVGINTDNPRASLEVSKAAGIAATEVQGLLLPQLTQAERNGMDRTKFVNGLQIYNTDKNCVDIWNGNNWQCIDGTKQDNQGDTPSSPSAVLHITQLGFGGVYKVGDALTDDNTVTFKVKNTGSVASPTLNFSNKVTFTDSSGTSPVTVKSGQHSSFVIGAGREVTLTYVLQGTPRAGNLTAKLTHDGNYAQATVEVKTDVDPQLPQYLTLGNGERSFVSVYDNDYWPYNGPTTATAQVISALADGLTDPLVDIQGKITTTGVEVYIPVTIDPAVGSQPIHVNAFPGTELDISTTHTQDNTAGVIKLSWGAQTLYMGDTYIKAKISAVGQDVNLKKLDFQTGMGQDYKGIRLGEFRYFNTQYGTQKSGFTVRLMPGIPDRRFLVQTKNGVGTDVYDHQFIYVPVIIPSTSSYNPNQVWLNNNLGAEYTRVGSPVFDPGQQAKEHNDHNAFGSLFQWGRPADGHELVTYTNATAWQFKYGISTTPTTTYPPQPTENQTVEPGIVTEANGVDTTPMWYAGTAKPTGFPVTIGDTNNSVCPKGFKVPSGPDLNYIIEKTNPSDKMKEFIVRLPSNRFKNADNITLYPDGYGYYGYSPKLWSYDTSNNSYISKSQTISGGNITQKYIEAQATTDYIWDSAKKVWRFVVDSSNNNGITAQSGVYIWGHGRLAINSSSGSDTPDFFRRWNTTTTSSGDYIWTYHGVPHTVSSSLAIRCVKE